MLYIYKHTCIDKSISIYHAYFLFRNLCCVVYSLCCVQVFVTPWTIAHQAPLSMGFPRQEYWSGLFSMFLHHFLFILLSFPYFFQQIEPLKYTLCMWKILFCQFIKSLLLYDPRKNDKVGAYLPWFPHCPFHLFYHPRQNLQFNLC